MKNILKFALVIALALGAASCTTFKLDGLQVNKQTPSFNTVGTFDVTFTIHELLGSSGGGNLLNISSDAMNNAIYDVIQREIQKGAADAAINIKVEYSASFLDMLLNGITLGIYAPATAHISGTLVKF